MTYTYQPGRTEGLEMLTGGALSFNFWAGEIFIGAVLPAFILLDPRRRDNRLFRMAALVCVVGGVVAYRWDINMAGQLVLLTYVPQELAVRYTSYVPSLVEFAAGAGVIAYGLMAFTLGVRYLNVVHHAPMFELEPAGQPAPAGAA